MDRFSATIGGLPTLWASWSMLVCMSKKHKSPENHNDEKGIKALNGSNLPARPGAHEKKVLKDFVRPYQEPRRVPLAKKAKACRDNCPKGNRQQ